MAAGNEDLQTVIKCVSEFLFTFEIKIVGIVQEYKYVGIILQEHLDFQAGGNVIFSKGGRAL